MKYFTVGYFVILFVFLGMFFVWPSFTQGEWMEFFMADTISLRQDNMAVIWVHHPVLHSDMSKYTLEAAWRFMGWVGHCGAVRKPAGFGRWKDADAASENPYRAFLLRKGNESRLPPMPVLAILFTVSFYPRR